MKYLLLVVLLSSPSLWAADQPLSKELIESFYALTEKMDSLEAKYPKIFSEVEKFSMADQIKTIRFIEESKAYPDVKELLSSFGFSDLNEFYDVSIRFMGGIYFVQMQKMPAGMDSNIAIKLLEENIKRMKKNGAPPSVISGMEESLKGQKDQSKLMELAISKASEADKKFVLNNIDWIMKMMPDAPEEQNEE